MHPTLYNRTHDLLDLYIRVYHARIYIVERSQLSYFITIKILPVFVDYTILDFVFKFRSCNPRFFIRFIRGKKIVAKHKIFFFFFYTYIKF